LSQHFHSCPANCYIKWKRYLLVLLNCSPFIINKVEFFIPQASHFFQNVLVFELLAVFIYVFTCLGFLSIYFRISIFYFYTCFACRILLMIVIIFFIYLAL